MQIICFGIWASIALGGTAGLSGSDSVPHTIVRNDLKKFYDAYEVDGMFELYDPGTGGRLAYHDEYDDLPVPPASTFNILLALVGLEEGCTSPFTFASGTTISLQDAFRTNTDSFFISLSGKIGEKKLGDWMKKIHYGNETTSGETNRFWINGRLRITPAQQMDFIEKFYDERYPFSRPAYKVVKQLMLERQYPGYKIYGHRGSNKILPEHKYTGWYVGYIKTTRLKTYFFVNYIQSPNLDHPRLVDAQKEIPFKIFQTLAL